MMHAIYTSRQARSRQAHPLVPLEPEPRISADPVADHGRRYAERLRESGTPMRLTEYPGVTHAFLSMPGVVPQANAARAEIAAFLRDCVSQLAPAPRTSASLAVATQS